MARAFNEVTLTPGGRILQLINFAVPICSLAQMKRLESVASTRKPVVSAAERARLMWIEAVMCFLLPPLMLPLLYVVQGHRYDIIESYGCSMPTYFSWPGILIRFAIPLALSLATLVYSGGFGQLEHQADVLALSIRWFLVRRLQFRAILASSHTGLSVSRYLRLIALAVVVVTVLLANDLTALATALVDSKVYPYTSWSDVHQQYGIISQFPEAVQSPVINIATVIGLYASPFYALIFFVFFGLGEDAIVEYIGFWDTLIYRFGRFGLKLKR